MFSPKKLQAFFYDCIFIQVWGPKRILRVSLNELSLVGMLKALEGKDGAELKGGSHVDRLQSKLAPKATELASWNTVLTKANLNPTPVTPTHLPSSPVGSRSSPNLREARSLLYNYLLVVKILCCCRSVYLNVAVFLF